MKKLTELVELVKGITGEESAEWGKMEIQHMLEHLILMMKISTEKLNVNLLVEESKIDFYKELVLQDKPFEKNLNNPLLGEEPSQLIFGNVEIAKKKFIDEFNNFEEFFTNQNGKKTLHPLLGYITKEEWTKYHIKHLSHHLVQFGLYEYGDSLYN